MAQLGKTQVTIMWTATPDLVAEGERIFASHADWMAKSHHKDGELAMLSYNIVKGPELSNPLDPSSAPTGNTSFVLAALYQTQEGLDDHWRMGPEWSDFGAYAAWARKCRVSALHGSPVIQSLW